MTYNVNKTTVYSSVTYQASLAGLGNTTLYASNTIATGDINGDGFNDIFCAPWISGIDAHPLVLIGDGTGKFTNQTAKYFSSDVTFDNPESVCIADFNADGKNDLVVFDAGSEASSDLINGMFPGAKNQYFLQTPSGFVLQSYLPNNQANNFNHASTMADVNGDGAADYLGTQLGGSQFPGYGLTLGINVDGQFVDKSYLLPYEIRYKLTNDYPSSIDFHVPGCVETADMDGDGKVDIITGSYGTDQFTGKQSVRISTQQADGSFAQQIIGYMPQNLKDAGCAGAVAISAADIDIDGRKDLAILWEGPGVSAVQLLHNDGNNAYSDVTASVIGSNLIRNVSDKDASGNYTSIASTLDLLDVNLDGFADLVFSQMTSVPEQYTNVADQKSGDHLYLNDGSGHIKAWTPNVSASQFTSLLGATDHDWSAGSPVTMDVNGDKLMDMVFLDGRTGSTVSINTVIAKADSSTIAGNNKLTGTSGSDSLKGGAGVDTLTGGAGADSFVFDNVAIGGADKITDFKLSEGDVFVFDADVFKSLAGGLTAENIVISAKPKAAEEDDYLLFSTKGKLYYDADGSGAGKAILIAGVIGSYKGIDYQSFQL